MKTPRNNKRQSNEEFLREKIQNYRDSIAKIEATIPKPEPVTLKTNAPNHADPRRELRNYIVDLIENHANEPLAQDLINIAECRLFNTKSYLEHCVKKPGPVQAWAGWI